MSKVSKAEVEKLLTNVTTAMNAMVVSIKPDLDEIEESIIKNMNFFGASDRDIEHTRKWIRQEMNKQARSFIVDKVKEMIDKKRA